jgi:Skp family chaperone for outer membrane proteins
MCASASAEVRKSGEKIRLGVADVELILREYHRSSKLRANLERDRMGEEFKRKKEELEALEKEFPSRRFIFFKGRANDELHDKREELRRMAKREAQLARSAEKEAVGWLLEDIGEKAKSIAAGDDRRTLIFDSNTPHLMFISTDSGRVEDLTDVLLEALNSQQPKHFQ